MILQRSSCYLKRAIFLVYPTAKTVRSPVVYVQTVKRKGAKVFKIYFEFKQLIKAFYKIAINKNS